VGSSSSPAGVMEPAGLRVEMIVASVVKETLLLFDMVFCITISFYVGSP
jgi:hypothetical protein